MSYTVRSMFANINPYQMDALLRRDSEYRNLRLITLYSFPRLFGCTTLTNFIFSPASNFPIIIVMRDNKCILAYLLATILILQFVHGFHKLYSLRYRIRCAGDFRCAGIGAC